MFRLLLILVVIAVCCCGAACPPSWADDGESLSKLDNTDISWGSSMFGIHPQMSPRSESVYRRLMEKDVDTLMKMLEDKDRFLVAHVLLAEIYPVDLEIYSDRFVGLKISSDANGKTTYPNYEARTLSRYWTNIRKTTKAKFPSQQPVQASKNEHPLIFLERGKVIESPPRLHYHKYHYTAADLPPNALDARDLRVYNAVLDDNFFRAIAKYTELREVVLPETNVGDAELALILSACDCEYLNVISTNLTDASVDLIAKEKSLKKVFIGNTAIGRDGVARLKKLRPDLEVHWIIE